MDIDLLFTAVTKQNYKQYTEEGDYAPESLSEEGFIRCFEGKNAQKIINDEFQGEKELLLLVVDPLRIQSPIKREKKSGMEYIHVHGPFSVDAIIDKIRLNANKKGNFEVGVKHFD